MGARESNRITHPPAARYGDGGYGYGALPASCGGEEEATAEACAAEEPEAGARRTRLLLLLDGGAAPGQCSPPAGLPHGMRASRGVRQAVKDFV